MVALLCDCQIWDDQEKSADHPYARLALIELETVNYSLIRDYTFQSGRGAVKKSVSVTLYVANFARL